MRATSLFTAAMLLTACAHGAPQPQRKPELAAQSHALYGASSERLQVAEGRPLVERDPPPREVSQSERPAPEAAHGQRAAPAAQVQTAAPTALGTAALSTSVEPTAVPEAVPVTPPEPAGRKVVMAADPGSARDKTPKLGSDISPADAELRVRVQQALMRAPALSYTAKHVHVDVARRQVTLRGEVRTEHERGELEQIVRGLPGVKELRNQVALINPGTASSAR